MVSQLMPCIDVLNEYFGLGIRYFDSAIQFQYDMNYSKGNPIPEEDDWEVYIPCYVEFEKVYKLLENAGLSKDKGNEKGIMDILAILANLIYDKEYEKADVILLGPQVRYALGKLQAAHPEKPITDIPMQMYGLMDGKGTLARAEQIMNEKAGK